jgi:hypothetical protein
MPPGDVVHVLRRFREALVSGGIMLDLQVVPPHPRVESDDRVLCEIDGTPLLARAEAAHAVVDRFVAEGLLEVEAVDDHDVLKHFKSGAALVDDFGSKERTVPAEAIPLLRSIERECVMRERCRLRRLRHVGAH